MMQNVMEIALKRSIIIPSSELYSPVGGFYDYGPVGKALKRKGLPFSDEGGICRSLASQ